MPHDRSEYPRGEPEEYPWVPEEGDEVYLGSYQVTVLETDDSNRRAYVDVDQASVGWEGYVPYYHLDEEKHDYYRDSYPWESE